MRQRRLLIVIISLLAIFIISSNPSVAYTETEAPKTVKVGYYYTDGYHVMDADGNKSGYAYEIIQHMMVYTDWQCEYIGYELGWDDMLRSWKTVKSTSFFRRLRPLNGKNSLIFPIDR